MIVLVACEYSAVVRDAFIARGHSAISCDLRPCEAGNYSSTGVLQHFQGDVMKLLAYKSWDLMIGHPPCTFLTLAGARWLYEGGRGTIPNLSRWKEMRAACEFFEALRLAKIPRICLENPVMHGHATKLIKAKYSQIIQPWQFGHGETKKTCLWLKNLPQLKPTEVINPDFERYPKGRGNGYDPRVHYESPGPQREMNRSRTLVGIAAAMAQQWG